jgi:AraC-like DNA-binding protein
MLRVLAAIADPIARRAVREALMPHSHVEICATRREVLDRLRQIDAGAVLTDLQPEHGLSAAQFAGRMSALSPSVPLVAVARVSEGDLRALLPAARAGVSELIVVGVDDPWTVVRRVARSPVFDSCVVDVIAAMRYLVREANWPVVEYCIRSSRAGVTVVQWSQEAGIRRNTLLVRLTSAGLPPPARLLSWGRLLIAITLMTDHRWSTDHVATELGFSSSSAFRKSLRRHAGMRPSEARTAGLAAVLLPFAATLDSRISV